MHAEIREHFADMDPEIAAVAEQLEREVAPLVWARIVRLAVLIDDHAAERTRVEVDERTAQTLAHFPGIAPAWWVVYAHLRDEYPPSCVESHEGRDFCQLPPLEEPA